MVLKEAKAILDLKSTPANILDYLTTVTNQTVLKLVCELLTDIYGEKLGDDVSYLSTAICLTASSENEKVFNLMIAKELLR